ncbi:MAG: prolipoprotein diacylglyceryl transferase [Oligoflexales bacterium]|nr:prolipoprotein diacylglyceryl transferase [Oligoflexales bacterium]
MYPILYQWGDFIIPSWFALFLVAATIAARLLLFYGEKFYKIDRAILAQLFICCYFGGLLGARFLSVLVEQKEVEGFWPVIVATLQFGPLTFYGGAFGTAIFGGVYIYLRRLNIRQMFDVALPPALLALALGRVGCFLNGDDFGLPVSEFLAAKNLWWTVIFPNLEDSLQRYPVQIFESGVAALGFFFLVCNFKTLNRNYGDGFVGIFGATYYAFFRFFIEYFRGDERGWIFSDVLSTSQTLSIAVLLLMFILVLRWSNKKEPKPLH